VREYVRVVLEDLGYTVLDAPDGEEALRIAGASLEPVSLLLTDLVMPGMNGRELADRFRELHREATILYMSGYASGPIGALDSSERFLPKPFSPEVLAGKVREALDAD
jgi:CheY-like chemotaxis protein